MAVSIGPRIGIDGEKEFRKSINDLITQQKTFKTEMERVESEFTKTTTAMEKNRAKSAVLKKAIENQRKQVEKLEAGLDAARDKYGENATQTQKWEQAVNNAKTSLNNMVTEMQNLDDEFEDLSSDEADAAANAKDFSDKLQKAGTTISNIGEGLTTFGEGLTKCVTGPLVALATASVKAWEDVDDGLDTVTIKTGATGEELESLQESAVNLATTIPTSFEAAGDAVGEVNTRFGLTGSELEDLSGKFIKFAKLNKTDVSSSVDSVQKVMAAFGMETSEAGDLLDTLNAVGQATGVSMDKLEASMIKNAASLSEMGFNAHESAAFLGQLETSGADTNTVMSGLQKALTNASKEGKTLPQALGEFQAIMDSTASEQEKLNAAVELFGQKAGPTIYEACKTGSLSFRDIAVDASDFRGNVENTFEAILDPADNFTIALNKAKEAGASLGGVLLDTIAPAVEAAGNAAQAAGDWFSSLDEEERKQIVAKGIVVGAIGPIVSIAGKLATKVGDAVTALGKFEEKVPGLSSAGKYALPIMATVGALAALKAGMDKAKEAVIASDDTLKKTVEESEAATETLNDAVASLKNVNTETKNNIDEINAKAGNAQDLIDELYMLAEQSDLTTEAQSRMKVIVDELNAMYPNLSLSIDSTTGSLSMGKAELENYIETAKKMALLEAYTNAGKDSLQALVEAEAALYSARQQQTKNDEYIAELEGNIAKARSEMPEGFEAQGYSTKEIELWSMQLEEAKEAQEGLTQAVTEAEGPVEDAREAYAYYDEQQQLISEDLKDTTESQEGNTEATAEGAETAEKAAKSTRNLSEEMAKMGKAAADAAGNVISDTAEAAKSWDDLYNATYESIKGQIGLFDEWSQNTETSASKLLNNLQSQVRGMTNYAENMEFLAQQAAESSDPYFKQLVQELAEMGVGAAGEVDALVRDIQNGGKTFNKYLDEYGKSQELKKNLAETATYIQSGFVTKNEKALKAFTESVKKNFGNKKIFSGLTKNAKSAWDDAFEKAKKSSKKTTETVTSGAKAAGKALVSETQKSASQAGKSLEAEVGNGAKGARDKVVSETDSGMSYLRKSAESAGKDAANGLISTIGKAKLEPKVAINYIEQMQNAKEALKNGFTNLPASMGAIAKVAARGKSAKDTVTTMWTNMTGSMGTIRNVSSEATKAKNTIESTNSKLQGRLTNILGVKSAADTAVSTGNKSLSFTGHMSRISGASNAAANAKAEAQAWLNGHPVYTTVYSKTKNIEKEYADGGFITSEQVALVGEGGAPEVIIPLTASKRSRALDLYEQAGEILGAEPPTQHIPAQQTYYVNTRPETPPINYDELYSAVATAARQGLQSANIRVYWDGRVAGRIMKDMGVQFV